ncbi:MAG: peptidylprolyl isomerase [Actinomycetia bacterium]|nr:peptidylprolyl isomerase [Actinomycetes bacterium]
MAKAKKGDQVSVHYTGTLDDGTVFDSSEKREPLQFTIGDGKIMPAFEQAVIGLAAGESASTNVPAEQAYGPYRDEMVIDVDRKEFPKEIEPKVGDQLEAKDANGGTTIVTVKGVSESHVKVDANHPLAGKNLKFDITLEKEAV